MNACVCVYTCDNSNMCKRDPCMGERISILEAQYGFRIVSFSLGVSECVSLLCCISWRINSHYVVISSICYLLLYACPACLTKAPKHIDFRNIQYFVGYFLVVCSFCFCVFFGRISFCELKTPRTENWVIIFAGVFACQTSGIFILWLCTFSDVTKAKTKCK